MLVWVGNRFARRNNVQVSGLVSRGEVNLWVSLARFTG
jgi:hypothetical protein